MSRSTALIFADLDLALMRRCLCCPRRFDSNGPHHRLCPTCSHAAGSLDVQMVG